MQIYTHCIHQVHSETCSIVLQLHIVLTHKATSYIIEQFQSRLPHFKREDKSKLLLISVQHRGAKRYIYNSGQLPQYTLIDLQNNYKSTQDNK